MKLKRWLSVVLCISMIIGNASAVFASDMPTVNQEIQEQTVTEEEATVVVEGTGEEGSGETGKAETGDTTESEDENEKGSGEASETPEIKEEVSEEAETSNETVTEGTEEAFEEVAEDDIDGIDVPEGDAEPIIQKKIGTLEGLEFEVLTYDSSGSGTDEDALFDVEEGVLKLVGTFTSESVVIPKEAKIIPKGIFDGEVSSASIVKTITFEAGSELALIQKEAFKGSRAQRIVFNISDSNTVKLEESAFENAQSLEKIDFGVANIILKNEDDQGAVKVFSGASALKEIYASGSQETVIPEDAFLNCKKLESVYFPEALEIEKNAFNNCTSLYTVNLPKVKEVGESAFRSCSALQVVGLKFDGVQTIGNNAFQDCGFTSLSLGKFKALSEIGDYAFAGCTKIAVANLIGNDNETITYGINAFDGCTSLTTVYIPDKLKKISDSMFNGCKALTKVDFDLDKSELESIGAKAFKDCTALKNIELPGRLPGDEGDEWGRLEKIEDSAFIGCTALQSVKIWTCEKLFGGSDVIELNAFPNIATLKLYGYNGALREYAERYGMPFTSLYTKYDIAVVKNGYATITPSATSAVKGSTVTIKVTPNKGYSLVNLRVYNVREQDVNVETISVSATEQKFSFVMPDEKVNIAAEITNKVKTSTLIWEVDKEWYDAEHQRIVMDKVGRRSTIKIRDSKGSEYLGSWLFTYTSSNSKVVSVDSNGVITGRNTTKDYTGKDYPVTIKATLKSDATKTVSIPVSVFENAKITAIDIAANPTDITAVRGIIDKEEINDIDYLEDDEERDTFEYPVITFAKTVLSTETQTITVQVHPKDENGDECFVDTEWISANTDIAKVSKATVTNNKNTIVVQKGCFGETGVTVRYKYLEEGKTKYVTNTIIIRVVDATPRLVNTKITVNTESSIGTKLNLHEVYKFYIKEYTVGRENPSLELVQKKTINRVTEYVEYNPKLIVYKDPTSGDFYVRADDMSASLGKTITLTGKNQLYLKGEFKGQKGNFYIPVESTTLEKKALNPKLTLSGKINLFYKNFSPSSGVVKVTQDVKNATLDRVALVSEENVNKPDCYNNPTKDQFCQNFKVIQPDPSSNNLEIRRNGYNLAKKSDKAVVTGYVCLYYKGFGDKPITRKVTIPTCDTAPTLKLSATKGTVNTRFLGTVEFRTQLVNSNNIPRDFSTIYDDGETEYRSTVKYIHDGTTIGLFDTNAPLVDLTNVQKPEGEIVMNLLKSAKGQATLEVKMYDWDKSLKYKYEIATTNEQVKATLYDKAGSVKKSSVGINTVFMNTDELTVKTAKDSAGNATIIDWTKFDDTGSDVPAKYKPTFSGIKTSANVRNAAKINIAHVEGTDRLRVSLLATDVTPGSYTFKYRPQYKYGDDGIAIDTASDVTITVQVTKANPTLELKATSFTLNGSGKSHGTEVLQTTYVVKNLPKDCVMPNGKKPTITGLMALSTTSTNSTYLNIKDKTALEYDNDKDHYTDGTQKFRIHYNEDITVSSDATYKFGIDGLSITVNDPNSEEPASKTISLKVSSISIINKKSSPKLTQTAKGTLNPIDYTSSITYTLNLSNITGYVTSAKMWEYKLDGTFYKHPQECHEGYSPHFDITVAPDGKTAKLTMKKPYIDDVNNLISGKTYKLYIEYTVNTVPGKVFPFGDTASGQEAVTVKPVQTNPKIKVSSTSGWTYAGDNKENLREVSTYITKTTLTKTHLAGADPDWGQAVPADIRLVSSTASNLKRAFSVRLEKVGATDEIQEYVCENGKYVKKAYATVPITASTPIYVKAIMKVENASLVPLNKAQKLKLELVFVNQMDKATGSTFDYTMTVKK